MFLDITGKRFGKLVAKSIDYCRTRQEASGHTYWICTCDCGNSFTTRLNSLNKGATTSCGCTKLKYNNKPNLIGEKFGNLVVINKDVKSSNKYKRSYWLCRCDCGIDITVRRDCLTNGKCTSCSCINKLK